MHHLITIPIKDAYLLIDYEFIELLKINNCLKILKIPVEFCTNKILYMLSTNLPLTIETIHLKSNMLWPFYGDELFKRNFDRVIFYLKIIIFRDLFN